MKKREPMLGGEELSVGMVDRPVNVCVCVGGGGEKEGGKLRLTNQNQGWVLKIKMCGK
jgi:hypothetical protein